jgi:signal transduction histidine kinase
VRVAVLPREVAARVITNGIARGAWAVNAVSLSLTIPLLVEHMLVRGLGADLPGPLAILIVLLAFVIVAAFLPRPQIVAAFLLVGAAGAVLYQVWLIQADPTITEQALFVLNRPAVSLVLVGVQSASALVGVSWILVGFLISSGVSFAVAGITGVPLTTGSGPVLMLLLYVTAYAVLGAIQARQRRLVPNFEELERETRRLSLEEHLRDRVTAVVHDTLLNDLSIVMNAPDELDERAVQRLRADVATLTSAEWLDEASELAIVDDQDSELRNRIVMMMSDLQWRGLTVRVTGSGSGIYRVEPEVANALVDAVRASLENVLRHSGASVAEVDLAYTPTEITVIVSDQGHGFDPDAVPDDRLGVRQSIQGRIRAVGGSVRIWSSPGAGTSVVIRVPVLEVVTEHREASDAES